MIDKMSHKLRRLDKIRSISSLINCYIMKCVRQRVTWQRVTWQRVTWQRSLSHSKQELTGEFHYIVLLVLAHIFVINSQSI